MTIKIRPLSLIALLCTVVMVAVASALAVINSSCIDSSSVASTYDNVATSYNTVESFTNTYDSVIRATYVGTGEVIGMGNGLIQFPGTAPFDDTVYYLENIFEIADIYKTNDVKLKSGNKVTILECIGYGETSDTKNAKNKSGEYILFTVSGQGHHYLVDPDLSLQQVENDRINWSEKALTIFSANAPSALDDFERVLIVE